MHLALPVAFAETLGLVHLTFPDQSITLWGAETVAANPAMFARNIAIFLVLLSGVGAVLVAAGAPLGHLFGRLPVLRAYTADLAGSLLGIAVFTVAAWVDSGPAVWLALGVGPLVWLTPNRWAAVLATAIVALGFFPSEAFIFRPTTASPWCAIRSTCGSRSTATFTNTCTTRPTRGARRRRGDG